MSIETYSKEIPELVVNWHLTESCNYKCNYCYATWSDKNPVRDVWKDPVRTLALLKAIKGYFDNDNEEGLLHGVVKWKALRLSLAGGEPMLLKKRFRTIVEQAYELGFEVSLITNGSFLNRESLSWLAPKLSMLGLSVDSGSAINNSIIGRVDSRGVMLNTLDVIGIAKAAREFNPSIKFKINTVVSRHNLEDDLTSLITAANPERWKLLRVLPPASDDTLISSDQFKGFIGRHHVLRHKMSIESNDAMRDSYIMINPLGRFYQNTESGAGGEDYYYSDEILEVGVDAAFKQVSFDVEKFSERYA